MDYKSILTFLGSEAEIDATLPQAIRFATRHESHLTACCLGVDMTPAGGFYMGASPILLQETLERAQADASVLESRTRRLFEGQALRWGAESAVVQFGGLPALVGLRARFSDLVIQQQPYGENTMPTQEAVIEAALFEGQAAVLVLPPQGLVPDFGKRVMIAWNQSNEALSAVRRALPLLQAADHVSVVVVNPPVHSPERSDPGGLLTQMLSRHGVRAEVSVLAKTMPRVSDVLMRHMDDTDASVMVMGAYGHSRLREAILGGATRNVLENARHAVFLAH
ncbi:MAG: universal stress protein [Rhodobacter sp.]|uniref:universal stress protein n=1 Tax=Pararhodobacter sp. TaxID=2127056 RepID=UPI001DCB9D0F|nr:universal stress protein [Pararhodobacter sp.]MCB1343913.1 universal stress protein [Paracoccaceae bacterium]MCC0072921.1 universal stress protein [Rhodobacter sp.]HPD92387.1 universal stress protein [Pararhodobacter sp.]